jgi:hypothetical protein
MTFDLACEIPTPFLTGNVSGVLAIGRAEHNPSSNETPEY